MTGQGAAALRALLLDMRASLVERLAHRFDGGNLALLGTVQAALGAVDRTGAKAAERAQHVAVVDRPGLPLGLMLSLDGGAVAAEAALDPRQALGLAGELIAAALPRLASPTR